MDYAGRIVASQRSILRRLVEWENVTGDLYETYAALFRASAPFWEALGRDERFHALSLACLERHLDAGATFWQLGQFREEAVAAEVAAVRDALERAAEPGLTEREALDAAVRLESGLIESGFYHTVRCELPAFAHLAGAMSRALDTHLQRLRDRLQPDAPGAAGPQRG